MNYYDARPLTDGSGWHYTCRNNGRIWAVGYCSHIQECPTCQGRASDLVPCATCGSDGYIEVEEPHPPHPTAEDAYRCATDYVLDHAHWDTGIRVDTARSVPRCEAPGCDVLVEDGAGVSWGMGMRHFTVLCLEHRNRDTLAEIVGTVGQVWSS